MKFDQTLMSVVKNDLENNLIPMLLGEPGIGKSSWLMDLGRELRTKVFVLPCNQLADKADLTGARLVPIQDENGKIVDYKQVFYPHAVIHDAIEYAKNNPNELPILFMDELNRTTPDITSEALSIPTLREIGSKKLPDNLRVVIAGNDKGNVVSLDDASISRFVLYRVEPCVHTFLDLHKELNPFVKNVLEKHPETIFGKTVAIETRNTNDDEEENDLYIDDLLDDNEGMEQITTPRTITGVSKWLNSFSNDALRGLLTETTTDQYGEEVSVLQECIFGHVGQTTFGLHLLQEITEGIHKVNNQSSVIAATKPACYDTMKSIGTYEKLSEYIEELPEKDKSGCLVYALYEQKDNNRYIELLAKNVDALTKEDISTLMNLSTNNKLDRANIQVLLETDTPIANNLNIILSVY